MKSKKHHNCSIINKGKNRYTCQWCTGKWSEKPCFSWNSHQSFFTVNSYSSYFTFCPSPVPKLWLMPPEKGH
jgi:hypothetical protein